MLEPILSAPVVVTSWISLHAHGSSVAPQTFGAAFADQVRATLRSWARESFDHLVNNAGHGGMTAFAETTEAQFDQLFAVHVKGVFFLTQALPPLLADGGQIANLSSGLTRITYLGFSA